MTLPLLFWFNTPPELATTYEQRILDYIVLNQPLEPDPDISLVRHIWLTDNAFDGPYVRLARNSDRSYTAMYVPAPEWKED